MEGINTTLNQGGNGGGGAAVKLAVSITYAALKALRDGGNLVPGTWYRITDYVCTTTQDNTQSAEHAFDVIVRADDASHLNENAFEPLKKTILDENLPGDYRRLLLIPLRDYGEQSIPVFEGILKGKNATLAVDAMNLLATNRAKTLPPAFFVPYLDAQHEDIRKGAMRALNIMARELSADDIRLIMKCKSREGKMLGMRMSSRLQRDERLQLMQDACLDDDVEVRVYGLREIGLLRPDGWDEMLLASLEDPSEQIQQIAAEGLSRFPTEKIQNALREYLPNCKDIRVQRIIQRALARRPIPVR